MKRRDILLAALAAPFLGRPALAAAPEIAVLKSPTCGCCSAWIDLLRAVGFAVRARDVSDAALWSAKTRLGVPPDLASCHTATVAGYFVEGHVPAADVRRLLEERPEALGVTVPGMPLGSPGMEAGGRREAFETLLVLQGGAAETFARHD